MPKTSFRKNSDSLPDFGGPCNFTTQTALREIARTYRFWGLLESLLAALAKDLKTAFPELKGFSSRNLKYMRRFAEAWPDPEFVQQPAAQLPWFHICTIMDKLPNELERQWYMHKAIEHGWSRNVLVHQIESRLMERAVCPPGLSHTRQSGMTASIMKVTCCLPAGLKHE